ncbi:TetR/AcrR family transcriptional regulator [Nocardioides sp. NPDC059952]|uniref:TetR/AcrR family transcriptional regulator n=1 Tax=Nocardioides sp. NPDC059952 TaxID=3347014 RepID=UPI003654DEF1
MTSTQRRTVAARPPNRRSLILEAAAELFAARGYEHVSMGDLAAAVGVGPSALYRHFKSKQEVLACAVTEAIDAFDTALADLSGGIEADMVTLAGFGLDHRPFGVLWEREARHLPDAERDAAHAAMADTRARFISWLTTQPDSGGSGGTGSAGPASAVLAVLLSPSFHHTELPRPTFDRSLAGLARRVLALTRSWSAPATSSVTVPADGVSRLGRRSKREQVLRRATELFAERTYASVSMEQIANALGMRASSLYEYFPTKSDLLVTALTRGNAYLQMTIEEALVESATPREALTEIIGSYTRFAFRHPHVVDVLLTETRNLPEEHAAPLIQAQRDYVDEWVHLARDLDGDRSVAELRIEVHAVLKIINDLARAPHLLAGGWEDVADLATRLLVTAPT